MKFVKGISLFFIYPCVMMGIGMYAGIVLEDFFYPGNTVNMSDSGRFISPAQENTTSLSQFTPPESSTISVAVTEAEVLTADTEYVIEEYDIRRDTMVESVLKVPAKYLGMNREEFVQSMNLYALAPPLSEQERGFVSLEVRSFSSKRVVVRMNYAYAQPTKSFYLRVENNFIVVYCDDGETIYMYTDILAPNLPEYIQNQVIEGMFIEEEADLYHFLETYSS